MQKILKHSEQPVQLLSGPEIETLADYVGQGTLGVLYEDELHRGRPTFHPITKAYDNQIAISEESQSALCMSTDSNRSEEGLNIPMRTCIEFRAGPELKMTQTLLHLIKSYARWLTKEKKQRRKALFEQSEKSVSRDQQGPVYIKMSDFILYYNALKTKKETLLITSPHSVFHSKNAGPEFSFLFPVDAQWVLKLDHVDLSEEKKIVFFVQYNLSLPIGCVFSPKTKSAFPLAHTFALLDDEKEISADFNESRPHDVLRKYEQQIFKASGKIADQFSGAHEVPECALGLKDFLRGMTFEIAMISTSQAHLMTLFESEALLIATQRQSNQQKRPSETVLCDTARSLANTLRKSLFSYFMKATLADFFHQLHPYEKAFLQHIPKRNIKALCEKAIMLSNGGEGNSAAHPSHFLSFHNADNFMEIFEDFYQQTFKQAEVSKDDFASDPIACLTDRFITPSDIGNTACSVPAVVIEIRRPEQGNQQYEPIEAMCTHYQRILQNLLDTFYPQKQRSQDELDLLWSSNNELKTEKRSEPVSKARTISFEKTAATTISDVKPVIARQSSLPQRMTRKQAHNPLPTLRVKPKKTAKAEDIDSLLFFSGTSKRLLDDKEVFVPNKLRK